MYPEIILICLDEFGKFHPGTSVSFGEKLSAISLPSSADDQLLHLPSHSPAIVWERHNIWSGMKSEYFLNDCDMLEMGTTELMSDIFNVSWDNLDMSWWIRQIPPWHFGQFRREAVCYFFAIICWWPITPSAIPFTCDSMGAAQHLKRYEEWIFFEWLWNGGDGNNRTHVWYLQCILR